MKRRILSIMMALAIGLSLLPGPALAAEEDGADQPTAYLSYVELPSGNSFPATITFSNLTTPAAGNTFTAYLLTGTYSSWESAVEQIGTENQVGCLQRNPGTASGTLNWWIYRDTPAWFNTDDTYTLVIICRQDSLENPLTLTTGSGASIDNVLNVNYWYFTVGDDSASGHGASGNTGVTKTTAVTLEPTTVTLTVGETAAVTAALTPPDSTEEIIWTSSNPEIASVEQNGTVTGLVRGQVTITARSGDCSAECVVTVNAAWPVDITETGLDISNTNGHLEPTGETEFQAGSGTITFQPTTETAPITLILDSATISSSPSGGEQAGHSNDVYGVVLDPGKDYNIVLKGNNRFAHLYTAISSKGNDDVGRPSVTISGDGTLTLDDCRTGINSVDVLTLDGVEMTVNALEYGITTNRELNILNGSDIQVNIESLTEDYTDFGLGLWYTNCAITADRGDVTIRDSAVTIETDSTNPADTYVYFYDWGIKTGNFTDSAEPSITVDNSSLTIKGFIYNVWNANATSKLCIENGSEVTIEAGSKDGTLSYGIYHNGAMTLDDSSLVVSADKGVRVQNTTGKAFFAGASSVEIKSSDTVFYAGKGVSFDDYIHLSGTEEAAYSAIVNNTAMTADGAVDWRFPSEGKVNLAEYQYLKITPKSPVVTFVTNCDTGIDPQEVPYQTPVKAPDAVLARTGYTFVGWYSDAGYTQAYDFSTPVTDNMTLYAKWLKNLPNPPEGDSSTEYQVVMEEGLSEVPEELKKNEELDTPAKIENALKEQLKTDVTGVSIPAENTAIYDVELLVSKDNGVSWNPATQDNFPADGKLTVTLPYPDGTDSSYTFTVVHMFTVGDKAGQTEKPAVTNTKDGIQFTVTGLSPISVGWTAPAPSSGSGSVISTYPVSVDKADHGKVTSNRGNATSGTTVTLTVTPDDGYVLDTLAVIDSRGNELKLTVKGDGKYTFTMPSKAVTVTATFTKGGDKTCDGDTDCPSRAFTDLNVEAWYHEPVDYVLRNGLMVGYGNGVFGPENVLSRAQLAQILYNHAGRPTVTGGSVFTDVADGAWYADAITWAAANGIVNGYGNDLFGPEDNITREQLAAILWRYAGSPASTGTLNSFTDTNNVAIWAADALRWAVENKIVNGKGSGILDPKGKATRAEVAAMLTRY